MTLFGQVADRNSGGPPGSSYTKSDSGLSAIHAVLAGYAPVRRWEKPPGELPDDVAVLVRWSLMPAMPEQRTSLLGWVWRGHRLVLTGGGWVFPSTAGGPAENGDRPAIPSPLPGAAQKGGESAFPAAVHPLTAGIAGVRGSGGRFQDLRGPWTVYLTRSDGSPVLAGMNYGGGEIFWSADPEWLTNRYIDQADNLRLALQLLVPATPGGAIAFDEYSQGFRAAERWWQILRGSARWTVALLGVAVALGYWSFGVRFGAPRPQPAGPPRAAVEYTYSMAQLYRRAGARRVVLRELYRSLTRELGLLLGGFRGLSHAELAGRAAERTGLKAARVEAILDAIQPDRSPEPSDAELVQAAREAEAIQRSVRNAGHGRKGNAG